MGWEEPEAVSCEIEGVTVAKRLEDSKFSIPAIEFRIQSPSEPEGTLHLRQPIPKHISTEDLRFHTDYNSFQWSVVEGDALFEMDLRPEETVRTVIGVDTDELQDVRRILDKEMDLSILEDEADRSASSTDPEKIPIDHRTEVWERDEPTTDDSTLRAGVASTLPEAIEAVFDDKQVEAEPNTAIDEPRESEAKTTTIEPAPETGTSLRSGSATEDSEQSEATEDVEEPRPEGAGASQEEIEMRLGETGSEREPTHLRRDPEVNLREGSLGSSGPPPKANTGPDGNGSPATESSEIDEGDKNLEGFIREVQKGEVSDSELQVLREMFVTEIRGRESIDARIRHLQTEVSDLAAYKSAMEEFLHAHGSGESIVDRLEDRMAELTTDVATLEESADAYGEQISKLGSNQQVFDRRQQDHDDAIESLQRDLNNLGVRLDQLETRLDELDLDGRLSNVEREVRDLREWREQMRNIFE